MPKTVDVVIIVEHLSRELESAFLLEHELIERGYSAEIVFKGWNEGPKSATLRPKVVVTPWCYDDCDVRTLCAYKGGFPDGSFDIVDLHSEQITSPDAINFVLPAGEARNVVHLCWGDFFKNELANDGIDPSLIHVVGSNRLDMFLNEYKHVSLSKDSLAERYSLDPLKPWILIVGNYSAAFFSPEKVAELVDRGIEHAALNSEVAESTYNVVLDWIARLVAEPLSNDVEIIYRPHPSEPITERLVQIESKSTSFHIVKELAIRDWFLNSKIALMWNSTSSVEAAFSELPVLSLRPIEIPECLRFDLLEKIEKVKTYDEMIEAIELALNDELPSLNTEFKNQLNFYYARPEKSATSEIANIIDSLIRRGKGSFNTQRPLFYRARKELSYRAKEMLFRMGMIRGINKYRIIADDHIDQIELGKRRDAIIGKL